MVPKCIRDHEESRKNQESAEKISKAMLELA
eukprot:UN07003